MDLETQRKNFPLYFKDTYRQIKIFLDVYKRQVKGFVIVELRKDLLLWLRNRRRVEEGLAGNGIPQKEQVYGCLLYTSHNVGQLLAASLIVNTIGVMLYLPVMSIAGIGRCV